MITSTTFSLEPDHPLPLTLLTSALPSFHIKHLLLLFEFSLLGCARSSTECQPARPPARPFVCQPNREPNFNSWNWFSFNFFFFDSSVWIIVVVFFFFSAYTHSFFFFLLFAWKESKRKSFFLDTRPNSIDQKRRKTKMFPWQRQVLLFHVIKTFILIQNSCIFWTLLIEENGVIINLI